MVGGQAGPSPRLCGPSPVLQRGSSHFPEIQEQLTTFWGNGGWLSSSLGLSPGGGKEQKQMTEANSMLPGTSALLPFFLRRSVRVFREGRGRPVHRAVVPQGRGGQSCSWKIIRPSRVIVSEEKSRDRPQKRRRERFPHRELLGAWQPFHTRGALGVPREELGWCGELAQPAGLRGTAAWCAPSAHTHG